MVGMSQLHRLVSLENKQASQTMKCNFGMIMCVNLEFH